MVLIAKCGVMSTDPEARNSRHHRPRRNWTSRSKLVMQNPGVIGAESHRRAITSRRSSWRSLGAATPRYCARSIHKFDAQTHRAIPPPVHGAASTCLWTSATAREGGDMTR